MCRGPYLKRQRRVQRRRAGLAFDVDVALVRVEVSLLVLRAAAAPAGIAAPEVPLAGAISPANGSVVRQAGKHYLFRLVDTRWALYQLSLELLSMATRRRDAASHDPDNDALRAPVAGRAVMW